MMELRARKEQLVKQSIAKADALKAFYGVNDNDRTFSTEIPDSLKNTEADFIIVVGNGFSH